MKHLPAFHCPQPFKKLNYLLPALLDVHSTFVLTRMKQQAIFTASTVNISSRNVLFAMSVPAFLSCDLVINVVLVMSEDKTSTLENETYCYINRTPHISRITFQLRSYNYMCTSVITITNYDPLSSTVFFNPHKPQISNTAYRELNIFSSTKCVLHIILV